MNTHYASAKTAIRNAAALTAGTAAASILTGALDAAAPGTGVARALDRAAALVSGDAAAACTAAARACRIAASTDPDAE